MIALGLLLLLPLVASQTNITSTTNTNTTAANNLGFFNSSINGGSFLTVAPNTYPLGLGEPINVIISSNSDSSILTTSGLLDFMLSIQLAGECLGQHLGLPQTANLGDGAGIVNQTSELRYDYGDPSLGTCEETILGGNHLRYWKQTTSGAIFMAVSYELNLTEGHNILLPDGYDSGRDWLTGNATVSGGTRSPITNQTYSTTSILLPGYLTANSSRGVNHGLVIDGKVAVWTVRKTGNNTVASSSKSGATHTQSQLTSGSYALAVLLFAGLSTLFN